MSYTFFLGSNWRGFLENIFWRTFLVLSSLVHVYGQRKACVVQSLPRLISEDIKQAEQRSMFFFHDSPHGHNANANPITQLGNFATLPIWELQ